MYVAYRNVKMKPTLKKSKKAIEFEKYGTLKKVDPEQEKRAAALKDVQSIIKYDKDLLARLLEQYRNGQRRDDVATLASINPSAYSAYLRSKKRPSEVTLIQLALYHELNYKGAAELFAAGGYNIECKTSIPMAVFRSFLKLREQDYKRYTDPEFFLYVCKKVAEKENVELKDQIFRK